MSKMIKITALAPGAAHAMVFESSSPNGLEIDPILSPVPGHGIEDNGNAVGFVPAGWAIAMLYGDPA